MRALALAPALTFGAFAFGITPAAADVFDMLIPDGVSGIRLGVGPVIEPRYDGDPGTHIHPAPLISFRYKDVLEVNNNQVRVNIVGRWGNVLGGESAWSFGPALRVDFGRKEDVSPKLRGLGDIGTSIETGAFVGYTTGPMRTRLRIRRDIINGHNGLLIDADVTTTVLETDRTTLKAEAQLTWANSTFMNKFFGVTPSQSALSGLPTYNAGGSLHDITCNLVLTYAINDHWSALGNLAFTRLLGSAVDAPLVKMRGSPNQPVAAVFGIYSF